MDEEDIRIYLASRRKEKLKAKAYYSALVVVIVAVIMHLTGVWSYGQIYMLVFVILANMFLDIGPWVKPTTKDLLDLIERQINQDPELIKLIAKKNA